MMLETNSLKSKYSYEGRYDKDEELRRMKSLINGLWGQRESRMRK